MAERIRVLLAEDHSLVRDGLKALLQGEFAIVAEAADGRQAVEEARRTRPDVVVMDAQMPVLSGAEAARRIKEELPQSRVLVLTICCDERTVAQCIEAGVDGYVLKDVETADLKRHIRTVARGDSVLDPKVAGLVMARVRGAGLATPAKPAHALTEQQVTILRLMAQGYSNREIAEELHLSENTIKGYTSEILHRLGVKNRVEAATLATNKGWL